MTAQEYYKIEAQLKVLKEVASEYSVNTNIETIVKWLEARLKEQQKTCASVFHLFSPDLLPS